MSDIRTPDQRLRVFLSSTLGELAPERRAVARALSSMRLTAVMFEAGARPHPPAELYRAYLEQSDVFLGLYWQRYGQLVPGSTVSGLEEEFELSRGKPRLLYLKTPAPDREPRLTDLVHRIEREASYRRFGTPAELGRLVRDDLAHLLSERFTAGPTVADHPGPTPRSSPTPVRAATPLPVSPTSLVGREAAIDDVVDLLTRAQRRLVTLTGPSGIGKTRLATAVAERLRTDFDSRTLFVPLEDVTDPGAVLPRIAWALGADLAGAVSAVDALADLLDPDRWLLVLDNLERLVAAGPGVAELVARSPGVTVLATSTTELGLRAERAYPVPPLPVPADQDATDLPELQESPAVALFVDRARAVRPDFTLTADHAPAVVEICRRLEGLPLAIELAAARVRLLDPTGVLRRLARSLDTLGTGMVDLPERQRTLRATVEWSLGMLGTAQQSLLEVLSVFADGWSVEAAARVAGLDEDRTLELTEALARHSLLHLDTTATGPRPRMLHTVRAVVAERLAARPDADEVHRRHAQYYREVAERADQPLRGFRQRACADILVSENANIGVAVRWHLDHDPAPLPHLFRVLSPFRILWPFLGLGDMLIGETRAWVAELLPDVDSLSPTDRAELLGTALVSALEVGDARAALAASDRLVPLLAEVDDPYLDAVSRLLVAWTSVLVRDVDGAGRALDGALGRLRGLDEPMWTALALVTTASVAAARGDVDDAWRLVTEAHGLAGRFDTPWLASVSRVVMGSLAVRRRGFDEARELLHQALDLSLSGRSTHCLCLVLDCSATLALAEGDPERAGLLAGATDGLRRRSGLRVYASMRGDRDLAAAVRRATGVERFDELFSTGTRLRRADVLDLVRDGLRVPVTSSR